LGPRFGPAFAWHTLPATNSTIKPNLAVKKTSID
jgi:hypothetical protein